MRSLKKQMAEHVKGTYLLMCGKNAKEVSKEIKRVYSGMVFDYEVPYSSGRFLKHFNFKRLFDKIKMAETVQKKIIDPYNVYHPIVKVDNTTNIDFTDDDFTWLKGVKK